jgi:outer membrane protein assembly factor BamB
MNRLWEKYIWKIFVKGNFVLLLLLLLNNCSLPEREERQYSWSKPLVSHKVVNSGERLKELWSRSNVFVSNDRSGFLISAARENVFIIGSLDENKVGGVMAFAGSSGELLWRGVFGSGAAINTTPSSVYVSMLSTSKDIRAYDLQTGQLLWEASPKGIRNVLRLYVFDNIVQVNGSNETFFLLQADTGEEIWKSDYQYGNDIYIRTDEVTFRRSGTSLQAIDTQSKTLIWEADVEQLYSQGPFFTDDTIFIRTVPDGSGRIYAIDRHSGEILWHTEKNVVSNNVAATNTAVYLLTEQAIG